MRAFSIFVTFVLVVGIMVVPASAGAAPRGGLCQQVEGTFLAQAVPTATGFDVYLIEATGPLAGQAPGTQLVWVTIEKILPGGTIQFTSIHVFETSGIGPFTTHDKGTIAPNGTVHNTLTIAEGGSGVIEGHGHVDLATGIVDVRYHGSVCMDSV